MRPITGWGHLMASTVRIAERSGMDGYGKPTYAAAATYRAHLRRRRRMVRTDMGQEALSQQTLYLMTTNNVSPTALVTLSTSDVGSTEGHAINPRIVAVERRFDGNGPHHVVLYLGPGGG